MTSFKMRVKEGQTAEAIQNYMFSRGVMWYGKSSTPAQLDAQFFFADGKYLTYEMWDEAYFEDHTSEEVFLETPVELSEKDMSISDKPVVSDGLSTSYYQLTITNKAGESINCEMGDVIRCTVGDNFSLGNVLKAARRMYEASQGRGKKDVSMDYDANKIAYFSREFADFYGEPK